MSDERIDPANAARLYTVARALSGALTSVEVADAVFERVSDLIGAIITGLWLVEAGTMRFVSGTGATEAITPDVSVIPLDADLPGAEALRTGRIVTFGSVEERNRRWPALAGVVTPSESTAVLPLVASGRPLGCLHISFPRPMSEADFDLEFLSGLAELCSAALDRAQLHDAGRDRQAFLLDASEAVSQADGFADALERLTRVAVPRLADLCLIDVAEEPAGIRRMAAAHADPAKAALVAELMDRYPPEEGGSHPAARAMAGRRSLWRSDMPEDYLRRTTRDEHHFELTRRLGFTSFMSVPLVVAGEVLGAITLVSAGSGRRFGEADLALAEDLARRAGDVVSAARRHEREHEVAHTLQRLLLPGALPALPGVEICARYLTARPDVEAGGDFYDVVRLPSGRIGFVIGDVEGHDPEAAAVMGQLRSAMRALAGQIRQPDLLLDALRWSWDILGFDRMATCLVGRLDPADGTLAMCSAGHPPPIIIGADGGATLLTVPGSPPLGVSTGKAIITEQVLGPGETLFLYTDGLVESGREGIDAEIGALCDLLAGQAAAELSELCDRVVAVRATPVDRPDDVAMLAIRRSAAAPGESRLGLPLELSAVATARRWLQAELADWSEEGRTAATLVGSELVANVVLHARTECTISLQRNGSRCRIVVSDGDPRLPKPKQYGGDAPTGRGLRLVGMLSLEWGIESGPEGKSVWAELADRPWPEGAETDGMAAPRVSPRPETTSRPAAGSIEVAFMKVPLAVLQEAQEHHDELLREFAFVAGSRHISDRLLRLAREVEEHFGETSDKLRSEIDRAEGARPVTVDLRVDLSPAGWTAMQSLIEMLDEADEYCDRLELLTLASSPEVRRLRRWMSAELRRQLAGDEPVPWPSGPGDQPTAARSS